VFRKSVSFFILVALFWVALWVYIPDRTPDQFSFSDMLRGILLLCSFTAFGFALLMLVIRYWGLDLASRLLPQGSLLIWLGKHAYEYSQPKVSLLCQYVGKARSTELQIQINKSQLHNHQLIAASPPVRVQLGVVTQDPVITWHNDQAGMHQANLRLLKTVKKMGRNVSYRLIITDDGHSLIRQ